MCLIVVDEELMQIEKCLETSFYKYNRGTAYLFKRAKARLRYLGILESIWHGLDNK